MTARDYHEMECPNCHGSDHLQVEATVWVYLKAQDESLEPGTVARYRSSYSVTGEIDWGGSHPCECTQCDWKGTAGDARNAYDATDREDRQ